MLNNLVDELIWGESGVCTVEHVPMNYLDICLFQLFLKLAFSAQLFLKLAFSAQLFLKLAFSAQLFI